MRILKKIYLKLNAIKLVLYKNLLIQQFVGDFPKSKEYFPNWVKNNPSAKIYFFRNKGILRKKPKTIEIQCHKNFLLQLKLKDKTCFVGEIENGRVLSKSTNIIAEDGCLIDEDMLAQGNGRSCYENYLKLPKIKKVNSRICVIGNSENYFHWMFEVLPRFNLIKKSKLSWDSCLISGEKGFQSDSIAALKLNKNQIINLDKNTHIKAKKLIFSSMPVFSGNPTPVVCKFLRKLFIKHYDSEKYSKYKKIYIMRGDAKNGRKVINEGEVINFLNKRGFVSIKMDGFSVFEQAKVFNSAKIIIAPHGAALTNLVFCKKGTKVIEFFNPEYVNGCYWALSNCVGLDYFYFLTKNRRFNFKQDILVSIDKLNKIMDLVGI